MAKDNLAMVASFMQAMNTPVSQGFSDEDGMTLGMKLICEEFNELDAAVDYYLCPFGKEGSDTEEEKKQIVKELADLMYVCYWFAARVGIDINEAFTLVHESNMSKLGLDGKPIYRADGKVLKGPLYRKPDLTTVVKNVPITLG